jgi:hypothetical protein
VWKTCQWTGRFATRHVHVNEYQLAKGVVLCVKSGCDKLVSTTILWKWRSKFGEWIRRGRVRRDARTGRQTDKRQERQTHSPKFALVFRCLCDTRTNQINSKISHARCFATYVKVMNWKTSVYSRIILKKTLQVCLIWNRFFWPCVGSNTSDTTMNLLFPRNTKISWLGKCA